MKRILLLTLAVLLVIGTAKAQTDRWIFPLVFTDATNSPDTVWFIQYNNEVTTLETILQEEGINPDVDTTRFHVYFTDSNGIKTRIATRQFSGNFNDVKLDAGLCEFPIQASWDKNLLSLSSELFGPITYSTIKSLYTELCSVDGGAPTDDDDLWANIFSMMDSTGLQPAAYYSENGAFYGDNGMLSWFLDSFFPMYVTLTREHFHHGNIGGFTATVNGHDVTLNWVYFQGCEHLNYFTLLRLNSSETELLASYTTTEMTFTETDVPAGTYIYSINGVFSDGTYVYDNDEHPFLSVIYMVTIEPAEMPPVTNLQYIIQGNNITLSWEASRNPYSFYSIYRNDSLLANTEDTFYIDCNVPIGTHAYSIIENYCNGDFSSPASLYITIDGLNDKLIYKDHVWPNPTRDLLNILFYNEDASIQVFLLDAYGRKVKSEAINNCHIGSNQIVLNTDGMPSGLYFVHIVSKNINKMIKFEKY